MSDIVLSESSGTKGLSFTVTSEEEKTCEVSNGTANSEEIIIPPYVFINGEQYTVTSIKKTGFIQKSNIKAVAIPETITKIGIQAFDGCKNLINIKIPSSVTELGSIAFRNCDSLEEIEIPDSVTNILPHPEDPEGTLDNDYPRCLFGYCNNLKKVVLGKGITVLPYQCFIGCANLTDIIIKGKITTFCNSAFIGVTNATIWVEVTLIDYYKKELKTHTTLPIKSYDRSDIRFRYSNGSYQVLANWFEETENQGYRFKGVASGTTNGDSGIGTSSYTPAYTIQSFEFVETDYKLKTETANDFEEYTESDGVDKKLTGVTITKFGRILANEFIEGGYIG